MFDNLAGLFRHYDGAMLPMSGILVLDKPTGISSAGLLNRIKRLLPRGTKIGHAGTLDPFATGVLLALIGRSTKRCEELMGAPKRYVTTVKLGATTATLDPETAEELVWGPEPGAAEVTTAVARFAGEISQVPPAFSAMKIGGRRAYDLARRGAAVELPPRPVRVYSMTVLRYAYPLIDLEMEVGRGFYVRSLARDLGMMLGSAGYLTSLRRTRVGEFDVSGGHRLETLTAERLPELLR
jgi:tRNA pseudouridine55 synthase